MKKIRAPSVASASASAYALAFALLGSFLPAALAAQDLSFHEASPRAAGLGGAFTARSDDATALFYNPAGLAFQGGFRVKADVAFARRNTSAGWPDGGTRYRTDPTDFTGSAGASWQPLKGVTIATGLFFPFGYESYWTPGWPGDAVNVRDRLRSHFLRTALAVEVFRNFALSAGLDVVTADIWYRHYIPFDIPNYPLPRVIDVETSHTLSGRGLGFVAGALWKILPALQIGIRYQHRVAVDLAGSNMYINPMDTTYSTVPRPGGGTVQVSTLVNGYFKDQDVTGQLTLPREIAAGIAFTPTPRLSLYLDLQREAWSGFGDWIFTSVNEGDAINPAFTPEYQDFYGLPLDYGVQGAPLALHDTTKIKTGLEYRPARFLAVRAGFARHQSSVDEAGRSPVYPDLDRNLYSLGFGYEGPLFSVWGDGEKLSDLSFDIFVRYSSGLAGASAYPGLEMTYRSSRVTFGVGAGFIF
jgi:long-chain fatty acid transport protein